MEVKTVAQTNPRKSICGHARNFGVTNNTMHRTIKKANGKKLVRVERPLLTPGMKETYLLHSKALLNNLMKAKANCIVIFGDEKTWKVAPVRNRQNDRYMS
ncbi:hypothetical protein TCAL_14224 [Tigriopus californicus]|uniref:Transposase Tc1-like domain-containing protein n=1 Tax=Tigriopus californicus TaxID=6832 RepID=A0A553NS35_TIGCA|nr:hypothetical protein TCAL_14224 [Tigriopus californicus]